MKPHACLYPGHLTLLRTAFPRQFYVTFKWLLKPRGFISRRWSRRSFISFGEEMQKKSPGPSATMLISLQLLQGLSTRKKRHLIAAAKRCKGGVSHFNDQIMAAKELAATPPKSRPKEVTIASWLAGKYAGQIMSWPFTHGASCHHPLAGNSRSPCLMSADKP